VGVARALVVAPRVLLLDDPTAGLDPATARSLLATVRAVAPDAAILLATQDVDVVLPLAQRAVLLGTNGDGCARDVRDLPAPFAPVAFASFLPGAQP
jgi:ABC-type methionine transport system ATPase subunit